MINVTGGVNVFFVLIGGILVHKLQFGNRPGQKLCFVFSQTGRAKTLFCLFADWHYAVLRETEFLAQLHSQIRRICRTEFGNEENHAVRNGFLTAQEAGEWQFAPTRILSTRIQLAHGDIRQPQIYT